MDRLGLITIQIIINIMIIMLMKNITNSYKKIIIVIIIIIIIIIKMIMKIIQFCYLSQPRASMSHTITDSSVKRFSPMT